MDKDTAARLLQARAPWCDRRVLESTLALALDIAREGREGRRLGAVFTVGRSDAVLERSRPLILDPIAAHRAAARRIDDPNLPGTVKELAQLDGAFVVAEDGLLAGACRYLDVTAEDVAVPLGLGSRHLAAAAVSKRLGVVAIAVSETGVIRAFHEGQCVVELPPPG